jgi:hypothetical protein
LLLGEMVPDINVVVASDSKCFLLLFLELLIIFNSLVVCLLFSVLFGDESNCLIGDLEDFCEAILALFLSIRGTKVYYCILMLSTP